MAKIRPAIVSLSAGELSQLAIMRSDLERFGRGAVVQQNMISLVVGPATKRPGTRHVIEVKDSSKLARLLPFEVTTEQAYQLLLGDQTLRFFRDEGIIVVQPTTAAVANGIFPTNINLWTDLSTGSGALSHDGTLGRMNLDGGGDGNVAWAEQAVTTPDTGQEHVLAFEFFGDPGDIARVLIGTASGGEEIAATIEYEVGSHTLGFTPMVSPFYIQFQTELNKTVQLDNVQLVASGAGAPVPLELKTTYLDTDIFGLKYSQSVDVFYLTSTKYRPRKIERRGDTSWSIVDYQFSDGPWLPENVNNNKKMDPAANSGLGIVLDSIGFAAFKSTDVGRLVRINSSGGDGWARIVAFNSTTQVLIDIIDDFNNAVARDTWQLGQYSDTTGWANHSGFHEERFWLIGGGPQTNRIAGSKTNDFQNFTPGTALDDEGIAATLAAADPILWMVSDRVMMLGTLGSEFILGQIDSTSGLTPTKLPRPRQTRIGSADFMPIITKDAILFYPRHARALHEMVYDIGRNGFVAPDLSLLADHMSDSGFTGGAYQRYPFSVVWSTRNDGLLVGMTYQRDENVIAWHRHPLGGDGKVESVSVNPGALSDKLWMIVRRVVGGLTKRYVEISTEPLGNDQHQEEAVYLDSSLTIDNTIDATLTIGAVTGNGVTFTAGSAVFVAGDVGRKIIYRNTSKDGLGQTVFNVAKANITAFTSSTVVTVDIELDFPSTAVIAAKEWRMTLTGVSGLDHQEGEMVQVIGDGAIQKEQLVVSGAITFQTPSATTHIGKEYTCLIMPLRFEGGAQQGSSEGARKRISKLMTRIFRSGTFRYGPGPDKLDQHEFRGLSDPPNLRVPLFTGPIVTPFNGRYGLDGLVLLEQTNGLPFTVLGTVPDLRVNEG